MATVTGTLNRWGCWDSAWSVPTSGGITQAHKRLGRAVLAEVFERVAEPARQGHRQSRVVVITSFLARWLDAQECEDLV